MALAPIADAEVERQQTELKDELMPAGVGVDSVNLDAQKLLCAVYRFEFPAKSGNWYKVDRVPYYEGSLLNDMYTRIREMKDLPAHASAGIFNKLFDQMTDMMWKMMVPENKLGRFLKWCRFSRNVLRHASEGDLSSLLSFFLVRRMMSNVRFHYPADHQQSDRR